MLILKQHRQNQKLKDFCETISGYHYRNGLVSYDFRPFHERAEDASKIKVGELKGEEEYIYAALRKGIERWHNAE